LGSSPPSGVRNAAINLGRTKKETRRYENENSSKIHSTFVLSGGLFDGDWNSAGRLPS